MGKRFHTSAFILIFTSFLFVRNAYTQEYLYEIGGMLGTSSYMGDANKTKLLKNPGLAAGAIFRYNTNFRWAWKGNLAFGKVSGNTQSSGNVFPNGAQASFERTFVELGGQVEFNFFSYSDKYAYLGTRRYTPYIFTGLGATLAAGGNANISMNIPLGIGFKYKLKERLNLGFEFSMRKLFGDSFDVTSKDGFTLNNPYGIESSAFKNKDWYSMTMITLTWDFGIRIDRSCYK
jgi:hypothetical protein